MQDLNLHIRGSSSFPKNDIFSDDENMPRHFCKNTDVGSFTLLVSIPNAQQAMTSSVSFWKSLQIMCIN